MARIADSEDAIWRLSGEVNRLREEHKQLFAEFIGYQQMLLALAHRHGGVLVFDPAELAEVPASANLVASKAPDGSFVIRLVTS